MLELKGGDKVELLTGQHFPVASRGGSVQELKLARLTSGRAKSEFVDAPAVRW